MNKILAIPFFVLFSFSAFAAAPAPAPTDKKITLSIELMRLMKVDQTMQSMQGQVRGMMEQQFETYATCDAAQPVIREFSSEVTDELMSQLTDESLKVDIAAIYADVFTTEELQGIIDFYRSPLGGKMIERMPDLMQRSMQITQSRMKAMMPELQSLSEQYAPRIREAAESCEQATESPEPASAE